MTAMLAGEVRGPSARGPRLAGSFSRGSLAASPPARPGAPGPHVESTGSGCGSPVRAVAVPRRLSVAAVDRSGTGGAGGAPADTTATPAHTPPCTAVASASAQTRPNGGLGLALAALAPNGAASSLTAANAGPRGAGAHHPWGVVPPDPVRACLPAHPSGQGAGRLQKGDVMSDTPTANARKTHCTRGHAFTPTNTIRNKRGHRECRACRNLYNAAKREERRAARRATTPSTIERFWRQFHRVDGCWLWQGYLSEDGYGRLKVDGKRLLAHRFAYEVLVCPIAAGLQIDHLCRNRACVNPAHLEPVTPRENTLRSTSRAARNALKTHCVHGHEFTPENTRIYPKRSGSWRVCRTCERDRANNERRAARRAERGRPDSGPGRVRRAQWLASQRSGVPGPVSPPHVPAGAPVVSRRRLRQPVSATGPGRPHEP